MPNIRYMPKWLAFLIPITLSFALLGALGCSSDDDKTEQLPPQLSSESRIANISVSRGTLEPAFRQGVRNYGVSAFYVGVDSFAVTVKLLDTKAKLTINGVPAISGVPFPVDIRQGLTTIPIAVTAEDGLNFTVASVTTNVKAPNTTVMVYDSLGGNYLDGAKITLRDALTNELLADGIDFPRSAQGTVFLSLDKDKRYNIYVRSADSAEGCFAGFDPSREDTVRIIARRDWIKELPASAPIVREIAFSPYSGSAAAPGFSWQVVPSGSNQFAGAPADMRAVRVTVMAESGINMTTNRGAIMVNIDDTASGSSASTTWVSTAVANDQYVTPLGSIGYNNTPIVVDGKRYYMTALVFDLNLRLAPGGHFLDVVAYDWANNRTEQKVYLDIINTYTGTDRDIRAYKPLWYAHRAMTYGIATNPYSAGDVGEEISPMSLPGDPAGPMGDTINVYFEHYFRESAPSGATITNAIRGYELERSTSPGGGWEVVRRRAYAAATGAPLATYITSGYDFSPELVGGLTYYYRLRYYNNSGYSDYSDVSPITILPSFNVSLVSPANQALSDTLWPTFKFRLSNAAILDEDFVDYCRFLLYVRTKNGVEFIKARFEIDYRALDEEGNPTIRLDWPYGRTYPSGWTTIDADSFVTIGDDGVIAIDLKVALEDYPEVFGSVSFEPGVSYEWNIYGDQASAAGNWSNTETYSMYFYKYFRPAYDNNTTRIYARSYASTPNEGSGAINGYFTLIMRPSAE